MSGTPNPPNQVGEPTAAIPVVIVQGSQFLSSGNTLPTSGGGGGGGSGIADMPFIDSTGQRFFYADNGTTITAYRLQAGAYSAYTPVAPITQIAPNALPLPTGAATSALQTSILTAIQAMVDITGTVWYDPTTTPVSWYIRRETVDDTTGVVTVTWWTPAGAPATPTVANLQAVSNATDIVTDSATYVATAGGTGYATGDLLIHSFGINTTTTPPSLAFSFWLNAGPSSTGIITAPTSGTYATATQQISGTVSVSNFPATQPVSGTVSLGAGAAAIGSVSVSNFPATQAVSSTQLPAALGPTTVAGAVSAVLASNQPEVPVNASPPQLLNLPASLSLAALNATVQWQVEGGVSYYLTLTNGPAATTQFVGTVTFQVSLDGATWNPISAVPVATPTSQATSTATAVGLWQIPAPAGATVYLRANMTAYTSGTVYALLSSAGQPSAIITLPWTYTVTTGNTVVGPLDVSGFSELYAQISAVTTTVLTAQGTNDPTLTTWDTLPLQEVKSQTAGVLTITAAGSYKVSVSGYRWFRLQCTTTGTVLTVQGVAARIGTPLSLSSYGNSLEAVILSGTITTVSTVTAVTTVSTVTSLSQIATKAPLIGSAANGSTNFPLGVSQATAVSQVDQNATAFAGAGSVLGTVVASAQGGGGVISAEINVSALTLGTATAVFAILQESAGGTNFTDIWVSDPITTTGIVRCPAIPVAGRRRWRFFSAGGASTTVTVTITALELPTGSYPLVKQFRDYYAATNPFASLINSVAQAASSFVLTTLNSTTTVFNVEGCKALTAFITLAGGTPSTEPVIALQLSQDGTNWWTSTATMTPAAAGTLMASLANFPAKYARLIVTTASAGGTPYTISNCGVYGLN